MDRDRGQRSESSDDHGRARPRGGDRRFAVPRPSDIHAELDRSCIGQDFAKKTLSVAVHNHYKRVYQKLEDAGRQADEKQPKPDQHDEVELEKTNILMIDVTRPGLDAHELERRLADRGVLLIATGPARLRAVTHFDVDDDGIGRALDTLTAELA